MWILLIGFHLSFLPLAGAASVLSPPPQAGDEGASTLKSIELSLNDALAMFIKQNFDVLIAKYGIQYSKGQEITAALFPNPVASIGSLSSFTQGRTLSNSAASRARPSPPGS